MNDTPRLPRVIIPQFPVELHRGRPRRRNYDVSDARRYGETWELVSPTLDPLSPDTIETLDRALLDSSTDDWLLAIGNPTLIAVAAAGLGTLHQQVNVLQWNNRTSCYQAMRIYLDEEGARVEHLNTPPN